MQRNSLRNRTGNYFGGTGNFWFRNREFHLLTQKSLPNDVFGTYRLALVAMLVDAQLRVDIRLLEAAIGDPCVRALDGAVDQRVRPAIAMSSADRSYVRSGFLRVSTRISAAPRRDNLRQDRDRNLIGGDGAEVEASRRLELGEPFRCNAPLR